LSVFEKNAERVSAVFLDLVMPVLGGHDIISELHRRWPGVKVILTSGYDVERVEKLIGKEKFAAFLQKPYTAARLAEAVKKAMDG
jgi:DNA-binding NtrC family response regulator